MLQSPQTRTIIFGVALLPGEGVLLWGVRQVIRRQLDLMPTRMQQVCWNSCELVH